MPRKKKRIKVGCQAVCHRDALVANLLKHTQSYESCASETSIGNKSVENNSFFCLRPWFMAEAFFPLSGAGKLHAGSPARVPCSQIFRSCKPRGAFFAMKGEAGNF